MRIRIRFAALLFVIAGGSLLAGSASAHAKYERSEPGDGALVTVPPARVDIWFTQELFRRKGDNRIQVSDSGDQPVQVGEVQIDNDDRKHMWVLLTSDLKPGVYRVDWNNVSAEDGDPDMGSFSFSFDPGAAITAHAPSTASVTAELPTSPTPPVATSPVLEPLPTSSSGQVSGGGGCIPGMIPVVGLIAITLTQARRRSNHR